MSCTPSARSRFPRTSGRDDSGAHGGGGVRQRPWKSHALELFAGLPRHYDRMGAVLSFGQDPRWRRALVRAIDPQPGQRVLDVATGTGLVAVELARAEARCEVVALDQSEDMLAGRAGRVAADPGSLRGSRSLRGEAERPPFADGEFDAPHVHLPAALRRRSRRDDARARARRAAGRADRDARVRRPAAAVAAPGVARATRASDCRRSAGSPRRVVRGRALLGPEHRGAATRRTRPARPVARRRDRRRARNGG